VKTKRATLVQVLLCTLIVLSLLCAGPAHAALHVDHAAGSDCAACLFASPEAPLEGSAPLMLEQDALPPPTWPARAPERAPCWIRPARGPPR
jgi:hypothetical protein